MLLVKSSIFCEIDLRHLLAEFVLNLKMYGRGRMTSGGRNFLMSCMKIAIGSEVSDRKKYYMGKFKQSQ
jgi:hypothetical protein